MSFVCRLKSIWTTRAGTTRCSRVPFWGSNLLRSTHLWDWYADTLSQGTLSINYVTGISKYTRTFSKLPQREISNKMMYFFYYKKPTLTYKRVFTNKFRIWNKHWYFAIPVTFHFSASSYNKIVWNSFLFD